MLGVCKAIGEIDATSAPSFNGRLHDAIDCSDAVMVVVDCSELTFIDSAVFHVLVDASEYAVRRDHTLVIRNMSPRCASLLRLCDSEHELRLDV